MQLATYFYFIWSNKFNHLYFEPFPFVYSFDIELYTGGSNIAYQWMEMLLPFIVYSSLSYSIPS